MAVMDTTAGYWFFIFPIMIFLPAPDLSCPSLSPSLASPLTPHMYRRHRNRTNLQIRLSKRTSHRRRVVQRHHPSSDRHLPLPNLHRRQLHLGPRPLPLLLLLLPYFIIARGPHGGISSGGVVVYGLCGARVGVLCGLGEGWGGGEEGGGGGGGEGWGGGWRGWSAEEEEGLVALEREVGWSRAVREVERAGRRVRRWGRKSNGAGQWSHGAECSPPCRHVGEVTEARAARPISSPRPPLSLVVPSTVNIPVNSTSYSPSYNRPCTPPLARYLPLFNGAARNRQLALSHPNPRARKKKKKGRKRTLFLWCLRCML